MTQVETTLPRNKNYSFLQRISLVGTIAFPALLGACGTTVQDATNAELGKMYAQGTATAEASATALAKASTPPVAASSSPDAQATAIPASPTAVSKETPVPSASVRFAATPTVLPTPHAGTLEEDKHLDPKTGLGVPAGSIFKGDGRVGPVGAPDSILTKAYIDQNNDGTTGNIVVFATDGQLYAEWGGNLTRGVQNVDTFVNMSVAQMKDHGCLYDQEKAAGKPAFGCKNVTVWFEENGKVNPVTLPFVSKSTPSVTLTPLAAASIGGCAPSADIIPLKGGSVDIGGSEIAVIQGDIKRNGQTLYDSDARTGLIVVNRGSAHIDFPEGVSGQPSGDVKFFCDAATADQFALDTQAKMLTPGSNACETGVGCATVDILHEPGDAAQVH